MKTKANTQEASRNNMITNGSKAIGGVLFLFAIVAGVYAMVEPMSQRIDFLERQLAGLDKSRVRHEDVSAHSGSAEALSAMRERFKEVETQFAGQDRRIKVFEEWIAWWNRTVPGLDATQNGRLDAIQARLDDLKALDQRIRTGEDAAARHDEKLGAMDKQWIDIDSKLQVELIKLDEKLQLEIKFSEATIKRIEADLERIRQGIRRQHKPQGATLRECAER